MSHDQSTYGQKYQEKHSPLHVLSYYLIKWLLIIALVFTILNILTRPIRHNWADDYLARGDVYLEQKKYLTAIIEYNKALLLNSDLTTAKTHADLADQAESNVLVLENFYRERKLTDKIGQFEKARSKSSSPSEMTKISRDLINDGEYQLAIVAARRATELDKNYQDGWIYLAIANLYSSKRVEISSEAKKQYETDLSLAKSHVLDLPEILK